MSTKGTKNVSYLFPDMFKVVSKGFLQQDWALSAVCALRRAPELA